MITVAAQDVQVGDELHNPHGKGPFSWVRVLEVSTEGNTTIIKTNAWDTWKHPKEGVVVRRTPKSQ